MALSERPAVDIFCRAAYRSQRRYWRNHQTNHQTTALSWRCSVRRCAFQGQSPYGRCACQGQPQEHPPSRGSFYRVAPPGPPQVVPRTHQRHGGLKEKKNPTESRVLDAIIPGQQNEQTFSLNKRARLRRHGGRSRCTNGLFCKKSKLLIYILPLFSNPTNRRTSHV